LRRNDLDPRAVTNLLADDGGDGTGIPDLIAARYLGPEVRRRLTEAGIGFVDSTGNIRVSLAKPGLFIEATGADRDPSPRRRPSRTLAGPKAGRIVRALCSRSQPWGVRELASATDTSAGYVSRLLNFLDREALIERGEKGNVRVPEWPRLLRRWAESAPLESRGEMARCIAPRGIPPVLNKVGMTTLAHAVSGSFAASRVAPVAPPKLLLLYVDDAETARGRLDLRPTDAGSNVLLIEPKDAMVITEAQQDDRGVCWAPLTQVAADLLTSPDRGPTEGDALIDWMGRNEESWRA
jgi:hypothetical protein